MTKPSKIKAASAKDAVPVGLPSSGGGFVVGSVLQLIPVQIDNGKAQIIIPPNQFTVFNAKGGEFCRIEIDPNIWMARVSQKRFEIDSLFHAIVECQAQAVIAHR